jgi:hypothetical protein
MSIVEHPPYLMSIMGKGTSLLSLGILKSSPIDDVNLETPNAMTTFCGIEH